MKSFSDLSPFFLLEFLKNDINVKDFCKLNSAFCNKLDRPRFTHCFVLECTSLETNQYSVLVGSLKIRSDKLKLCQKVSVFNFDTTNRSLKQKWETFNDTTHINGIGVCTTVAKLLTRVVKVGDTFVFWNCGRCLALNKDYISYSTDEFTIGKTIYSVGLMVAGTFKRDESKIVDINFSKLHNETYKGGSECIYNGQIKGDWMCGKGAMKYQDESIYQGNWKDDQCHGEGEFLLMSKGEYYSGTWFMDKLCGTVEIRYSNGDVYNGGFMNSAPCGLGTVTHANGNTTKYNSWGVK